MKEDVLVAGVAAAVGRIIKNRIKRLSRTSGG